MCAQWNECAVLCDQAKPAVVLRPVQVMLAQLISDLLEGQLKARQCGMHASGYSSIPVEWMKDFCTVRLSSHRRSGHTMGALLVVPKIFKSVAYVAINDEHAQSLRSEVDQGAFPPLPTNLHIVTAGDGLPAADLDAIILDPASYYDGDDSMLESIYHCAMLYHIHEHPCAIILLG